MITGFALWIAVALNGEQWEAIPHVYESMEQCQKAQKLYTKEIVEDSECFYGTFSYLMEG